MCANADTVDRLKMSQLAGIIQREKLWQTYVFMVSDYTVHPPLLWTHAHDGLAGFGGSFHQRIHIAADFGQKSKYISVRRFARRPSGLSSPLSVMLGRRGWDAPLAIVMICSVGTPAAPRKSRTTSARLAES